MRTKRSVASIRWLLVAGLMTFLLAGSTANLRAQRDRGFNQPGAAGNRGTAGRDPGFNQPGAAGNVGFAGSARQTRAVGDPGVNQPGRAGNVDPGRNQPGRAGNR